MHCFVPSPLSIKQSSAASKHHCHRRRRNKRRHHGSTRNNNEDDNQSSSCSQSSSSSCCCCGRRSCGSSAMSACSSATSLSSCASVSTLASTASMAAGTTTTTTTVPTTTTKTTNTTHNVTTVRPKKRVHFAPDASLEQVHVVRNMRKFKFPQWLWWQRGELPSENEIVAQLLGLHPYSSTTTTTTTTTTLTNWNLLSSPHDRARRLAHATLDLLAAHAKRGGGRHSLQRQPAAERHFQATMAAAAPWRGLESLIVSTTGQGHVGAVVLAAQQQQQPHTQEPQPLWQVARPTSRPAAQLAIQRARFDAQQVDK